MHRWHGERTVGTGNAPSSGTRECGWHYWRGMHAPLAPLKENAQLAPLFEGECTEVAPLFEGECGWHYELREPAPRHY